MRKRSILIWLVAAFLLAPATTAGAALSLGTLSCAGAVSWNTARKHVGRVVTVRGPVVDTYFASSSNGQPTFLNLGARYPDTRRFTVVIWSEHRARFGRPEVRYYRRTVCVRGLVEMYNGAPEIQLASPSRIRTA
jgi:hypothetical protein